MDNFGEEIISYFFMCVLSIAASPQHQDMRVTTLQSGYYAPYASTTLIKRQGKTFRLSKWSKAYGKTWAVIRTEQVTDARKRTFTRYICREPGHKQSFALVGLVPNLHAIDLKSAGRATLKLSDERTTIQMKRQGKTLFFAPSRNARPKWTVTY